jgi:hypothetical protein
VIDGPQSVVFQQAANRMHAQKGLLAWLLGGKELEGGAQSGLSVFFPSSSPQTLSPKAKDQNPGTPTPCRPATSAPISPPGPFLLLKLGHRLAILYK